MEDLKDLLQDNLIDGEQRSVGFESVVGPKKILGLYFSAHWCPPCRGFTPELIKYYNERKKKNHEGEFEIVFVSSDRDQSSFDEYYKEMPWLALNFEARENKATLSKKYGVRGIPTLILINGETGETICSKARAKVTEDPDGFPWYPKSLADVLYDGGFLKNDNSHVPADDVKSKIKGIYFSAHWCPPCRSFTPDLVKAYNKLKENGKNFEIIFASSDRDADSFKEYFGEMPWLALPHGDKRKQELSDLFDVDGIPTLVILDENDKKITSNGRGAVGKDPEGNDFPWRPKPLESLDENAVDELNEKPCFVYFKADEKEEDVRGMLEPVAKKWYTGDSGTQKIFFFMADDDEELTASLKNFTKLKKDAPFVAIIDLASQKVYEHEGELSTESLEKFTSDYNAGELQSRSLSG